MVDLAELLSGRGGNAQEPAVVLQDEVVEKAIGAMNAHNLPTYLPLYDDEPIPTNQRNLTDVRTRVGPLLEYEFAKAVNRVVGEEISAQVRLTYVIAHKFPDLAFRHVDGDLGIRLEVKALQTIAEETAPNFDTLIKDIRRGSDFVVTVLWDWHRDEGCCWRFPRIDGAFVMDAYHLAVIRDTYWLNRPPKNAGGARQGFDLCFGVNCREGEYNRGNSSAVCNGWGG